MPVNGKANRAKGHNYERFLAQKFRDMGYTFCKTTRAASRVLDSCQVDLAFIPYNVQAKKVKATINYTEIFDSMESNLKLNFPPNAEEHNKPLMIFHSRGKKDSERLVVLKEKDMFNLLKKISNFENKPNKLIYEG
jgi:hypothetical protein